MRVVIESSPEAAAQQVVARVAALVAERPRAVLGLAAGRSMVPVYAGLAALCREGALSLRQVSAFTLDEYLGAGPADTWSFRHFVQTHLVGHTDLRPEAVHAPDGLAQDWIAEAGRYEAALQAAGGIDLQLVGIGRNGHVGFNEPGSSLRSRTRAKALSPSTLDANRDELASLGDATPHAAITLGLGTLLDARHCVLLAVGAAKAGAVAAAVEGPLAAHVPASVLQLHTNATVVLDRAAASALRDREYFLEAERLQREFEARRRGR